MRIRHSSRRVRCGIHARGQAMKRLEGKRAIVTGAASGIGRASVRAFVAEGAAVLAVDLDAQKLDEVVAALRPQGEVLARAADVSDEADVASMINAASSAWGGVDVIFANAGIGGGATPFLEQTVEQWERTLHVNLLSPFLAIKHGAPLMAAQGRGSIICTASVAGLRANASSAPYSASKAGVISLVQTAANALDGSGVRVNAVCPGLIETGMTQKLFEVARARGTEGKIGQLNPLHRAGAAEEVAAVALFLASDEASYVNGQAIAVDGGLSSTLPFARQRK
jgi:NAD(P)-dependent dehydrogenase (short-subunit alcohol dehydrogenase family)